MSKQHTGEGRRAPTIEARGSARAQGEWTPDLVEQAFGGDDRLLEALAATLAPIIRSRVSRRLHRSGVVAQCGEGRYGVDDVSQDVFERLLAQDGRMLRAWDPSRGLGLPGFVRLLTDRLVGGLLRARGRRREAAVPAEQLERRQSNGHHAASETELRDMLEILERIISCRLSPKGLALYRLLFVEERAVEEVARRSAISRAAVYAWRSRIRRQLKEISIQLELVHGAGWPHARCGVEAA